VRALQGAFAEVVGNDIFGNTQAGVAVESGASPHIHGNWIHSGRASGVVYFEGGMGSLESNTVWGNEEAGLQITEGSEPLVTANRFLRQVRARVRATPIP